MATAYTKNMKSSIRHHPLPKKRVLPVLAQCCYYLSPYQCDAFSSLRLASHHHHHHAAITPSATFVLHDVPTPGKLRNRCLCSSVSSDAAEAISVLDYNDENDGENTQGVVWIIQWRGEGTEGYSEALRKLEFSSAFLAEMKDYLTSNANELQESSAASMEINKYLEGIQFHFQDALTYRGPIFYEPSMKENDDDRVRMDAKEFEGEPIPLAQAEAYESAMQYIAVSLPSSLESISNNNASPSMVTATLREVFQTTIQRCSLIRTAFQVAAEGQSYEELAKNALDDGSFADIMEGGINEDATWSIRLRRYGPVEEVGGGNGTIKPKRRQARYGKNVRSPLRDERKAIASMTELVQQFQGKVDLTNPECRIYLLEGLKHWDTTLMNHSDNVAFTKKDGVGAIDTDEGRTLLARVVAKGPKTSIYAPKTRICVTTTPLCPIASFTLCNIARLQRHGSPTILDPFAGSCATLLAAAHITSMPTEPSSHYLSRLQSNAGGCRSVAIEIAHNGYVNRDDIIRDFETRSLPPPSEIIRGSCLSSDVRHQARLAIGGNCAFDVIVTDPPYGIREAMSSEEEDENIFEDGTGTVLPSSVSPLTKLFYAMGQDRSNGTPLLKPDGRLVAFIPVRIGESLEDCLPDHDARKEAGLVMEGEGKEQVLSDILSRWLVSFVST